MPGASRPLVHIALRAGLRHRESITIAAMLIGLVANRLTILDRGWRLK